MRLEGFFRVGLLLVLCARPLHAHSGHTPIAVKGIQITTAGIDLTPEARANLGLETAVVGEGPIIDTVPLTCQALIAPEDRVVVTSRIQASLARPRFHLGDRVKKGDPLLTLESFPLQTEALNLTKTVKELSLAEANLSRMKTLAEPGITLKRDLDEMQANVKKLLIQREEQRARLGMLGLKPEQVRAAEQGESVLSIDLASPVAGVVLDFPASRGKVVQAGTPLVEIGNTHRILAQGLLTEETINRVRPGQPATVEFSAQRGPYHGRVELLAGALDETAHALPVYVEIDNRDDSIHPNQFGRMEILVKRVENAVLVPKEALSRVGLETGALCEEGNKLVWHAVVTGLKDDHMVQVLSGLYPGDRVVVKGHHELVDFLTAGELTMSEKARRNIGFSSEAVELAPLDRVLTIPAAVEVPQQQRSFASSRVGGRLEQVRVRPGMKVKAGEILATVRSIEAGELVANQARSAATVKFQEELVTRLERLIKERIVADKDLITAKNELALARVEHEGQLARLKSLDIPITTGEVPAVSVRSPTTGILFHADVPVGSQVEPEQHILEIVDTKVLWVVGDLPEASASLVKPGQAVRIRFGATGNRIWNSRVLFLEPVVDNGHRALHVIIELTGMGDAVRPGMLGSVTILTGSTSDVIRVPKAAVIGDTDQKYVILQEGEHFLLQPVILAGEDDRYYAIEKGVYPGEQVVTGGVEAVRTATLSVR